MPQRKWKFCFVPDAERSEILAGVLGGVALEHQVHVPAAWSPPAHAVVGAS